MSTPILDITEVADGQIDQFATYNAALRSLEAAANDILDVDLSAGNATVALTDIQAYAMFRGTGHTVARDLTLTANKRVLFVINTGTGTISVKLGSASINVTAAQAKAFLMDGTANGLWAIS